MGRIGFPSEFLGESAMEALLASAYTVLTKPVDPDDLLALIKSIPK